MYIVAQLCTQLSPQNQFSRQQLQKGPETSTQGRWLQAPGDISGYIHDRVMDYSTDIVKNHFIMGCVNVLIKLNLPQSILYKTRLRNLFFLKLKLRRFILFKLGWLLLFSIESKYRKV